LGKPEESRQATEKFQELEKRAKEFERTRRDVNNASGHAQPHQPAATAK
jgi:hypothetical protein